MSSPPTSPSSRVLECSLQNAFESLSFLTIPGMNLIESQVNYYHDHTTLGEENAMAAGVEDTKDQCGSECLLDMHEFVWQLIDLGFKRWSWFVRQLLHDGRIRAYTTKLGRNFGWAPVINTFTKLMIQNDSIPSSSSSSYRIEAGGGSGLGFQLFCDGRMVMTAGGGGGGGIEGSPRRDTSSRNESTDNDTNNHTDNDDEDNEGFNFGGGGGGGLQYDVGILHFHAIDDTNVTMHDVDLYDDLDQNTPIEPIQPSSRWQWESEWISIGGGGGCGTCASDTVLMAETSNNQSSSMLSSLFRGYTIACGERSDDDSIPNDDINNDTNNPSSFNNNNNNNSSNDNDTTTIHHKTSDLAVVQIQAFLQSLSQVCKTVELIGGGGGGGGTAECSVPYMFGYGFSMHGIWKKSNVTTADLTADSITDATSSVSTVTTPTMMQSIVDDRVHDANNNNEARQHDNFLPTTTSSSSSSSTTTLPLPSYDNVTTNDQYDNVTTNDQYGNVTTNDQYDTSDYQQRQYDYDLVGALLHDAAVSDECSATGGYADWCCTSRIACSRLRACMTMPNPNNVTIVTTDDINNDSVQRNDGMDGMDNHQHHRHLRVTRKTNVSDKNDVVHDNHDKSDGSPNGVMDDYNQFNRVSRQFITDPSTTTANSMDRPYPVDHSYSNPSFSSSSPLVTVMEPPPTTTTTTTTTKTVDESPSKPLSCERLLSGGSSVSWLLLSDCCVVSNNNTTDVTTTTMTNRTVATTNDNRGSSDSYLWSPSDDADRLGDHDDSDNDQNKLYAKLQICLSSSSSTSTSSSPESDTDITSLTQWATYAIPNNTYGQPTSPRNTYPSTVSPEAPDLALFSNPYVTSPWQCLSLDNYQQQQQQQQQPQQPLQQQPLQEQPQYQFFGSNKMDLINYQIEATSIFVWFALVYILLNIMLVAIQAAIDRLRMRRLILRAELMSQQSETGNES